MPLTYRAALPAARPAVCWFPVAEPPHDELGQVAGREPPAPWAPATEFGPLLENLTEGAGFDALQGRSMIARQGQAVSPNVWRIWGDSRSRLSAASAKTSRLARVRGSFPSPEGFGSIQGSALCYPVPQAAHRQGPQRKRHIERLAAMRTGGRVGWILFARLKHDKTLPYGPDTGPNQQAASSEGRCNDLVYFRAMPQSPDRPFAKILVRDLKHRKRLSAGSALRLDRYLVARGNHIRNKRPTHVWIAVMLAVQVTWPRFRLAKYIPYVHL